MMYDAEKAAQVALYFTRLEGGKINRLKLMKLTYLAEREHLRLYGEPMFEAELALMHHGPVPCELLDISYSEEVAPVSSDHKEKKPWHSYIQRDGRYYLTSKKEAEFKELDEINRADTEIIEKLYGQHKEKNQYELRDYTHTLQEWTRTPKGKREPIHHKNLFMQLDYNKDEADELCQRIKERKALDETYAVPF